jgi:filamentous hemagglutinin
LLQTEDGRIVDVERVEKRFGKFDVYNFNVEGIPTYFVSDLGILVHNANCAFPSNDSQIKHIFRNKPGHLPDTPEHRKLSKDVADAPTNLLGSDKYGNTWFAKILPDGRQVWVRTRNDVINKGGINDIPKTYNPATGLNNPTTP